MNLQRLVTKIVIVKVTIIDNRTIQNFSVGHDELVHRSAQKRHSAASLSVDKVKQHLGSLGEALESFLV
jgi:hypothetical protein